MVAIELDSPLAGLPELETAALAGGRISYRKAGSGPGLLCLHGLGGGSKSWAHQLRDLADRFTVVAWDCPGYGASDRREPSVDAYADAAAELIRHLDLAPVLLVGHSMGGLVAGALAARHPDLVDRLVLSCTFWGEAIPAGQPISPNFADRFEDRKNLDDDAFGLARATGMTGPDVDHETFEAVAEIAGEIRLPGYEDACRVLSHTDNRPLLAELDLPVLVVEAEHDSVMRRERTEPLAAMIPGARRVTLPGVGHAPYIEDGAAYNAMLREFADR